MKTIREWLKTLPEPYRELALLNLDDVPLRVGCANEQSVNLACAIYDSFWWVASPQGNDFWADIHTRAQNGDFDKLDIDCTIPDKP
jgi:hypothetical protein